MTITRGKMKGFLSACLISGFGLLELGILAIIVKVLLWGEGKNNPYLVIGLCLFVIGDSLFNVYLVSRVGDKWLKKDE